MMVKAPELSVEFTSDVKQPERARCSQVHSREKSPILFVPQNIPPKLQNGFLQTPSVRSVRLNLPATALIGVK